MSRFIAACLMVFAAACGGASTPTPKSAPPLTPEQERAFDNGVDFVASLEGLEGRWRDDWDRDLTLRVSGSEIIALVTVRTLRTDTDPQQRVTYRLRAHVDRELVGRADAEIDLAVMADQAGYASVNDNPTRVADKQFVAFVRPGPEGPRWHLSHASESVLAETERKITELQRAPEQKPKERVIVHTN